jgi:hypothetical protein
METTVNERPVIERSQRIYTKVKFTKSEQTGAYIAFVSKSRTTRRIEGVRKDSDLPKKICIISQTLAKTIVPNILYKVTLIPMTEKDGYIAIEATPASFRATIETTYIKGAVYKMEIKFGNQTILFDPVDGRQESTRTIRGVKGVLEKRMDVKNLPQVIEDFLSQANLLMNYYDNDGVEFRKKTKKIKASPKA